MAAESFATFVCGPLRAIFLISSGFEMGAAIYDFMGASWLVSWTLTADDPPPAAINDLVARNHPTEGTVQLDWTAPGADGNIGQAEEYDIRYSTQNITESNWNSAIQVEGENSPNDAGSEESFLILNLAPTTTYYFAIKTSDGVGWSDLSNVASTTTPDIEDITPPAAITDLTASNPTSNSITLNWTAPGDDGNEGQATEYDIRYSTSEISEGSWSSATQVGGEQAPQPVGSAEQLTVFGLNPKTLYYFAIKTRDEVSNWSFISNIASTTTEQLPDGYIIDYDGNVYKTVQIGNQMWMAENLKVTHYRNGDTLPNVTNYVTWAGLATGAYCEYDNDVSNVPAYGRLYNWFAIADIRGIAPEGWHVPTDAEWKTLADYLGGSAVAGGKMKATTSHWHDPNTGATNESGFSGLPGGYRFSSVEFYWNMGGSANFWSSTDYYSWAWSRSLWYNNAEVGRNNDEQTNGMSIRCIKD